MDDSGWENFPSFDKISKVELAKIKNRLKINNQEQSKLIDTYLENLLSENYINRRTKA
jgi:hypothetical protein